MKSMTTRNSRVEWTTGSPVIGPALPSMWTAVSQKFLETDDGLKELPNHAIGSQDSKQFEMQDIESYAFSRSKKSRERALL